MSLEAPTGLEEAWAEWVASRPPSVQALCREFPLRTVFPFYLVGYTESDEVLVSPIDPAVDFTDAVALAFEVCADHLRKPEDELRSDPGTDQS